MKRSKWDQRIERAEALAEKHPFAGEVLRFYKEVASLQRKLDSSFEKIFGKAFDASSNPLNLVNFFHALRRSRQDRSAL